jgi:hypothetical protein
MKMSELHHNSGALNDPSSEMLAARVNAMSDEQSSETSCITSKVWQESETFVCPLEEALAY